MSKALVFGEVARSSFVARNGKIEGVIKNEFEKQKNKKDTR